MGPAWDRPLGWIANQSRMADAMNHDSQPRRTGFTLIELLVVITIIGILIALILVAANDGVRRAEERATQGLITKLETALNDRLDALLNAQAPINQTHRLLAAINIQVNGVGPYVPVGTTLVGGVLTSGSNDNSGDRRAQVIAQADYIKAELPDVFFVNSAYISAYPLNFAAPPYPSGATAIQNFVLPLGNNSQGLPFDGGALVPNVNSSYTPPPISGMFGASFSAAGGAYKNLYTAAASDLIANNPSCAVNITPGFDGIDNNGDGLIDELTSPSGQPPEVAVTGGTPDKPFAIYVANRLAKHTHKTARSEMLYAVLVEGLSPLGSAFSREDFTNKEVQDTDGDGLPEFVDAWGQPLQFYRWPIYYGGPQATGQILGTSDSQSGDSTYGGPSFFREQDPLDTNQLLVSPGWWSVPANPYLTQQVTSFSAPNQNPSYSYGGGPPYLPGQGAIGFMNYFHSLVDANPSAVIGGAGWDRGGNFYRRAYFSKFLILSGGPDQQPGTAQFNLDYNDWTGAGTNIFTFPDPSVNTEVNALYLNYIENQAAVCDPVARRGTGAFWEIPDAGNATTHYLQTSANGDDITNHNISGISTGVR
jgi:prepilin-type N-terminal cleavage/methylation domain-containing protein